MVTLVAAMANLVFEVGAVGDVVAVLPMATTIFGQPQFGNRPQCQVCNKYGHSALKCYHRFNPWFQAPISQPQAHLQPPHS